MSIFIFPHYKSMATISCYSNQSSYPIGTKKKKKQYYSFPLSIDAIYEIWRGSASEEMSFENVDDGRTTDACLYYKLTYEPSAQVS